MPPFIGMLAQFYVPRDIKRRQLHNPNSPPTNSLLLHTIPRLHLHHLRNKTKPHQPKKKNSAPSTYNIIINESARLTDPPKIRVSAGMELRFNQITCSTYILLCRCFINFISKSNGLVGNFLYISYADSSYLNIVIQSSVRSYEAHQFFFSFHFS